MGKYTDNQTAIFSVFDSTAWKAENIEIVPADYRGDIKNPEYARVSIIPGSSGFNKASITGILIIDIFTPAGLGPLRQNFIADKLDDYLENKTFPTSSKSVTQFMDSSMQPLGFDKEKPSLSRAKYQIPFHFSRSE